MQVKVVKLDPSAILPTYAKAGDAGADLYANETTVVWCNDKEIISTGISMEIPEGYVGYINPRSGVAANHNVTVLNAPGTIDSGYRGEIKVILFNHDKWNKFQITKGDRIAQMVFHRVESAEFIETNQLNISERGDTGFGSSGA
jgi:dUTP pyrophosphatase